MLRRACLRRCTANSSSSAPPPARIVGGRWTSAAIWSSLGTEFHGVDESKFLLPAPIGFLSPRATTDVQPAEELLSEIVKENEERYSGVDVRDPSTITKFDGESAPKWLTLGGQVKAVGEFISGHLCHHVALRDWNVLFDIKYVEMDLTYWLYVLHVHMVARRATSVPISMWNRRREVLDEVLLTMFDSWIHTSEDIMGRPPLQKIRQYIKDMYYVTAVNLEEALLHDGPGGDLMLAGCLMKFCPLPRPEDVPVYTYYTLVHYVRFHTALLDRIPDESIAKGNFNFLSPTDPAIFKRYDELALDDIIRGWRVGEQPPRASDGDPRQDSTGATDGPGQP
jgi:hypothetical protein